MPWRLLRLLQTWRNTLSTDVVMTTNTANALTLFARHCYCSMRNPEVIDQSLSMLIYRKKAQLFSIIALSEIFTKFLKLKSYDSVLFDAFFAHN